MSVYPYPCDVWPPTGQDASGHAEVPSTASSYEVQETVHPNPFPVPAATYSPSFYPPTSLPYSASSFTPSMDSGTRGINYSQNYQDHATIHPPANSVISTENQVQMTNGTYLQESSLHLQNFSLDTIASAADLYAGDYQQPFENTTQPVLPSQYEATPVLDQPRLETEFATLSNAPLLEDHYQVENGDQETFLAEEPTLELTEDEWCDEQDDEESSDAETNSVYCESARDIEDYLDGFDEESLNNDDDSLNDDKDSLSDDKGSSDSTKDNLNDDKDSPDSTKDSSTSVTIQRKKSWTSEEFEEEDRKHALSLLLSLVADDVEVLEDKQAVCDIVSAFALELEQPTANLPVETSSHLPSNLKKVALPASIERAMTTISPSTSSNSEAAHQASSPTGTAGPSRTKRQRPSKESIKNMGSNPRKRPKKSTDEAFVCVICLILKMTGRKFREPKSRKDSLKRHVIDIHPDFADLAKNECKPEYRDFRILEQRKKNEYEEFSKLIAFCIRTQANARASGKAIDEKDDLAVLYPDVAFSVRNSSPILPEVAVHHWWPEKENP